MIIASLKMLTMKAVTQIPEVQEDKSRLEKYRYRTHTHTAGLNPTGKQDIKASCYHCDPY